MENFFLGEYIKQRREALCLTQKQVCEGICTPVTLSRIENGAQTPSRTRINAILQRLGLPDDILWIGNRIWENVAFLQSTSKLSERQRFVFLRLASGFIVLLRSESTLQMGMSMIYYSL